MSLRTIIGLCLTMLLPSACTYAETERSAVAAKLRQSLTELEKTQSTSEARKAAEVQCRETLKDVSAAGEAGKALTKALQDSEGAKDDAEAVDRLRGGMKRAVASLDFKPRMEAPLPKGFPAPGPVGEIIVKEYPAYRLARTNMNGPGQNGAFNTLFRHIQSNDIPMTAPVEMGYSRKGDGDAAKVMSQSMAFLYAAPDVTPAKREASVEVVDVPAMTVVSIGVRGTYTDERMKESLAAIDAWLAEHKEYTPAGEPRYFGYNSPFNLPWTLYGEVQVPVKKAR